MMLSFILTIMTSVAAVWLSVPLVRWLDRPRPASAGHIEGRRGGERGVALVGATGIVVLGSAILYAVTGNPDPVSKRTAAAEGQQAGLQYGNAAFPPHHPPLEDFAGADRTRLSNGDAEPQAGLPTVEEMTRRLSARLARNPRDTEGWRTLGWSYLNIGRFPEAAEAYARASELDPANAEFRSGRIEALVGAADGVVTSEAKTAIEDTLKLDPKDDRARYFAGLARQQEGDKAAALAEWSELLKEVNSDEPWASDLRSRISDLRRDIGLTGGAAADGPRTAAQSPRPDEKGPAPQDLQAAGAMVPADRSAMIRGMVDGLASRLERSPRDTDGWIKLIRSRVVLGEGELAKQALTRGLAAFADDAAERDRIAAAAQELGVGR